MMFLVILLISQLTPEEPIVVKDLRNDWMVFEDGSYRAAGKNIRKDINTIYFSIDASHHKGHQLQIEFPEKWELFVGGRMVSTGWESGLFSLDSLSREFGKTLFIGVHASEGIRDGITRVVSVGQTIPTFAEDIAVRPRTYFRDYGIIASVFLILFFLLLYRSNPQLTIDYFSFSKIFAASERNESQLASRIASSVNLLFYLFCALLTGFLLSAIFYSSGPFFHAARPLQITTMGSAFLVWLKLSLFILVLLASKLAIVLLFSTLFNFRETISFQFFNFLRFVLFTGVIMALLSLVFFIFRVDRPLLYEQLIVLGLILLSIGSVVVLIKLLGKARFSFFHLFSYLCVSEFIPLVIIIKIFF